MKRLLIVALIIVLSFLLADLVVVSTQSLAPLPLGPAHELVLPDGNHYAYVWEQEIQGGITCVWTEGSYDPVCSCPCEVDCIIEETTVITSIEPTPEEPTLEEPTPITIIEPTPEKPAPITIIEPTLEEPTPIEKPVECKPGWGHGDDNHCHDGPPGQRNKIERKESG